MERQEPTAGPENPPLTPEQERLLAECRAELAALENRYGSAVVAAAWDSRQAAPTTVEPEIEPTTSTQRFAATVDNAVEVVESAHELNAELQRLQEILKRADLPIFLEVHLNDGDVLLGTKLDVHGHGRYRDGYNGVGLNLTDIDEDFAKHIYDGANKQRKRFDRQIGADKSTLSVISIKNVGPSGSTAVQFAFKFSRPDKAGRRGDNFCTLYFTPAEAEEVLSILRRNDPNEVLNMVLRRIDPALIDGEEALSPHEPFTSVNLGEMKLPSTITIPKRGLFGREEHRPPNPTEISGLIEGAGKMPGLTEEIKIEKFTFGESS
ncbi:MAG: hypothetical protein Q7S64_00025 [bacterium]|nr:hypothetical protein [bacterium]